MCLAQSTTNSTSDKNIKVWRPDDNTSPSPAQPGSSEIYRPDILTTIEATIKELDSELRELSLDIHAHPELGFKEFHAHDAYTAFIAKQGFEVTKHLHLETAWQAIYTHGSGGRTIGINSEMDALPSIGHACGHNLIGISGVAVACALKTALEKHNISGKIVLLGTPGYNNISALRQQIRPTHRIHGIFEQGKNWAINIIPDYAKFQCLVRAPTLKEVKETSKRVTKCFEAAGLATGCEVKINNEGSLSEIRQNSTLGTSGGEVANIVLNKYGDIDYEWGIKSASTDFGNITYALPSLHPGFAIPTIVDGGNHTPGFTESAALPAAHYACLDVSKALAATAVRVLLDDDFYAEANLHLLLCHYTSADMPLQVRRTYEEDEKERDSF
ncbi:hypothetical protein NLJ89_g3575 [Agrocybe chaxingu]|uniref:Peptidase M20 domain-containing protein 2 n=1 Tax=Agrocybe chaxingu TaxID=84603 RepID=A0A9W8KAV5_9AGAR|nr:hypothetical protein NLJ89_g3575 [Agrocybe chaxingu]